MGSINIAEDVHIIFVALSAFGHVRPFKVLAQSLSERGHHSMTFITGSVRRQGIDGIKGLEFVPFEGTADRDPMTLFDSLPERALVPEGPARLLWDIENIFFGVMHDSFNTLLSVISRPELKDKRIAIVADPTVSGILPITLGSAKVPRSHVPVIALGHCVLLTLSKDIAPYGSGLPPQTEEVNQQMNAGVKQMFSGVYETVKRQLTQYDCAKPFEYQYAFEGMAQTADLFLQLCIPELEFPRKDLPQNFQFVGALLGGNDNRGEPEWFDSFVRQGDGRPLVVVTSGTLPTVTADELILPSIEICRDLPVRVVVCAVSVTIPDAFDLPSNVRVATWLPFQELFKYTDIVISNGGYGGVTQALASGIPMVLAGVTEDKLEASNRAEKTGAVINLKTQRPSNEQVKTALESILNDKTYKENAIKLKEAYASYDTVGLIEKAIADKAT